MSKIRKTRDAEKGYGRAILSNDVRDYSNEPFFVNKVEKAKEALKNIKLPEEENK